MRSTHEKSIAKSFRYLYQGNICSLIDSLNEFAKTMWFMKMMRLIFRFIFSWTNHAGYIINFSSLDGKDDNGIDN